MPPALATDADRAALDLMLRGMQITRLLGEAARLGIADRIAPDATVPVATLAESCGARPEPLLRTLRALAALGVFRVTADGSAAHTPRSLLLRTDTPHSLHHAARFWSAPGTWGAWGRFDAAMDGGVPHEAAWNTGRFAYLRTHPEEGRIFDRMMANYPDNRHPGIAAAYDFSAAARIVDIGGGNGATLRHILGRFPNARGVLFDRDDVVRALTPHDLLDGRIEAVGGDFFGTLPPNGDIYLLVTVLHNWADDDAARLLRAVRQAAGPGALLLIGEQVIAPEPVPERAAEYLMDVQMLTMFGAARERTEAEFSALLARAGFALRRVLPLPRSPVRLIEAAPNP